VKPELLPGTGAECGLIREKWKFRRTFSESQRHEQHSTSQGYEPLDVER
jgi:hypothetical protein